MSEYELVCDACGTVLRPEEGVVSWREDPAARSEGGFALTHVACAPRDANARREARALVWPNGYLAFFGERFARLSEGWSLADGSSLEALLHALAPFVMRHDSAGEMDAWRAASFGARPGVKPGEEGRAVVIKPGKEEEGGK